MSNEGDEENIFEMKMITNYKKNLKYITLNELGVNYR